MRAQIVLTVALLCSFQFTPHDSIALAQATPESKLREQSIYIPYEKLQETFEKEGRGVFVPYERFQELWKAAREAENKPPESAPPVKALITEIDSLAVVDHDVVRVRATAKIDLLTQGWLTIPLRLADAAVLSAQIGDEPARLVPHPQGQALLLKKDGSAPEQIVLQLNYAKAFTKAPGQNSVSFQAPSAQVNRWTIRVPDSGVKVNVHPMLAATEVPPTDVDSAEPKPRGETVVLAFVGAAENVKIDWTPKAEGATGLDALVGVQTDQRITIEEGITRTYTTLTYNISRAELSELRMEVPGDQKVVNVLDANVRGWNVEVEGDKQLVTVELFQPARKTQQLAIELEQFRDATTEAEVVAPIVKAIGVGRQRGIVLLQVGTGLRAEAIRRSGLSQMAAAESPGAVSQERFASSYRYAALPFDLAFRVEKVQPRIEVDQLVEAILEPRKLAYWLTVKYDIQKAGVFELSCSIPEGLEVSDVRGLACAGASPAAVESFARDPDDPATLKINLSSKAEGSVGLVVEMARDLDAPNLLTPTGQSQALAFSPPRAIGDLIIRSTGRLILYAPESLRLTVDSLTGLRSVSPDDALQPFQSVALSSRKSDGLRPLAYRFSGDDVLAEMSAQRRQPQLTATQVLVANISPAVVKYEATFDFNIQYSGVESLRVDLPETVAGRFRNETRSLRDQPIEPVPDDVATGYAAIKFSGDTELLGRHQFKLTWEEPIDSLDVGKSVDLAVPLLVPRGVSRADGQIVLVKAETIDVRPKNIAEGLDPIDPQVDLMEGIEVPEAAAALEFRDSNWDLTLTATRYQLENLKHTSVEQGLLRMVITLSDRIAVQALYRMRSNMQRLEIELPHDVAEGQIEFDTEPLRINGQAVTLERGDGPRTFFVPLVGYATNEPFLLELRFTMPGDGSELRYPFFPNDPATQRIHLLAYLPRQRELIGRLGPWSTEMAWHTGSLFQRRFLPKQDANQLVRHLQSGIRVIGNPAADFPVQGTPLLFTTLRPRHPDDGALRLKTVDRKFLDAFVLVGCLTIGVLLLSQTYIMRFMLICGTLGVAILMGVFVPTLAGQVLDQTILVAATLVALLWLSVTCLQGVRAWKNRPPLALAGAGGAPAAAAETSDSDMEASQGHADDGTRSENETGEADVDETDEQRGEDHV